MSLTDNEIQRYSRQLILQNWGSAQQSSLKSMSVAVSCELPSAALYLAASGVGRILLLGESTSELRASIQGLNPNTELLETSGEDIACEWAVLPEHVQGNGLAREVIRVPVEKECAFDLSLGCSAVSKLLSRIQAASQRFK